jgi:hypothetical protein
MARVEIASQAWGWLVDANGNPLSSTSATLKNLDGTNATHWTAVTGGSSATSALTSNSDGTLPKFVEEGSYTLTVGATSRRVEAAGGEANWENVKRWGAVGDGTTDDTTAVEAAVAALPATGGAVFFPRGTFLVNNVGVTGKDNVTFTGPGTLKRKAGTVSPDNTYVVDVQSCDTFRLVGLTVDFNNIERFGGFNIGGCAGVEVDGCRFYDSNLNASWSSYDHYALVIQTSTDVRVHHCIAEDCELVEVDNNERVEVDNNVSLRAAGTCAIGWFSVGNGYYAREYNIHDNVIIDPRKRGILFQHESGGPDNNDVRNIQIHHNTVCHLTSTAGSGTSALIDFTTAAATGTGNTLENVSITDNVLYVDAALTARTGPHLRVRHVSGNTWDGMTVARNKVWANTTDWAIDCRFITNGQVEDNKVVGTATSGVQFHTLTGCRVAGNHAKASANAFGLISSGGGNVVSGNEPIGSPTAVWHTSSAAAATDRIVPGSGLKSVASAATLTLPLDAGDVVSVTGSTTVTSITATGMAGRRVTLVWAAAATFDVTDGSNLKLASSITAHDADDSLTLACDGTNWLECGRSVN